MIPLCESEGITILCCTSSTLLKSKHAKADSREECNTFPVLERKDKGRKLCLLSANPFGIRDGVKHAVLQGGRGIFLIKAKNAKAYKKTRILYAAPFWGFGAKSYM